MYQPDNWVILEITNKGEKTYKVLAGWSGGYLDGDFWQLNSGITKVENGGDFYLFHGHSGSVYKCHKNSETVRMNIAGILNQILEQYPKHIKEVSVEEIDVQ